MWIHVNFEHPVGLFYCVLFYTHGDFNDHELCGLVLQKWIPLRLAALRREAVYEKIPEQVHRLKEKIYNHLMELQDRNILSETLIQFCQKEVMPHFQRVVFPKMSFFSKNLNTPGMPHKFDTVSQFLKKEERRVPRPDPRHSGR